ncbi:MAG: redoxin domain-containing protein [Blastocatellia bacterium]
MSQVLKLKAFIVSCLVVSLMAVVAAAQTEPQTSQALPDGKELLTKVKESHQNLKTFHFEGQTVLEMKGEGMYMRMEMPFAFASGKAGQKFVRVKEPFVGDRATISDGQTEWAYVAAGKQFTKKPFDKSSLPEEGASAFEQFSAAGAYANIIKNDLSGEFKSVKVLREEVIEVGGQRINCYVVEAISDLNDQKEEIAGRLKNVKSANTAEMEKNLLAPMTLWVDKERLVILRQSFDGGGFFAAIFSALADNAKFKIDTTINVARVDESLPDSLFAFTPPADAKEVEKLESKLEALMEDDEAESEPESLVGKDAANFALTDLNGKSFNLKNLRGKIVVVDFWASWCGPCRETMPHIEKLHKEFKSQGLVVLGINDEDIDDAKKFVQKNGYTFPTLVDVESAVSELYGITGIPQTLVIDRDGKIFAHFYGSGEEDALREAVKVALNTKDTKAENEAKPKKQLARNANRRR